MPKLDVHPVGGPLGAEIRGIDLSAPQDAATIAEIKRLWDAHMVLLFRDQKLDDPALMAFSRHFGELDPPGPNPYGAPFLPEFPEINVISNVKDGGGKPIGNLGDGEAVWHADMTYVENPPMGAILYALEVPLGEGDTHFANMIAAAEALPADLRAKVEGRTAIHDAAHNSAGMLRRGYTEVTDPRQTPGAHHPILRPDPVTGKEVLFLGRRPHAYINGCTVEESEALLDALWAHASEPRFAWAHQWREGDVLMWQNQRVLHRRDAFDGAKRRVMHRTQIRGTAMAA